MLTEAANDGHSFVLWSKLRSAALQLMAKSASRRGGAHAHLGGGPLGSLPEGKGPAGTLGMPAWPEERTPLDKAAMHLIVRVIETCFCYVGCI